MREGACGPPGSYLGSMSNIVQALYNMTTDTVRAKGQMHSELLAWKNHPSREVTIITLRRPVSDITNLIIE